MENMWILKFTEEGGVWATDTPPSLTPASLQTASRRSSGAPTTTSPLEVGDFVLASGKRAEIKNIFLSVTHGALARLFFIDTAEDGTTPLYELTPLSEELLCPPLAQQFVLDGVSPRLNVEKYHSVRAQQKTICVGHLSTAYHQNWGLLAMETLRSIAGRGSREVEVYVDIKPGDRMVILCDTDEGELNFNDFLIEAGLATPPPTKATPPPCLPSSNQLSAALESLCKFQTDVYASPDVKPTTISQPVASEMPTPYQYHTVYVESPLNTVPYSSLEQTGFPPSACKVLTNRDFQAPSLVQGCSWPLVGQGGLAILVSPPLSGKTLAYLLPLVTRKEIASSVGTSDDIPLPRLIVLTSSSWGAQAVSTRAVELMSALSAHRRFRCCCAYKALEGQATVELLNGVEVLVCTPTSLLSLVEKTVAHFDCLRYLVLDDFEHLWRHFSSEVRKILALCSSNSGPVGVVVTTSRWSPKMESVPALISNHAHLSCSPTHLVIACPIEATVRTGVKMDVIPCLCTSPDSILQQLLNKRGHDQGIVCVATVETANELSQHLKSLCWPVAVAGSQRGESFERLLQKERVIILPDSILPSLLSCGSHTISHITHYELPKNKTAFTNRLALLYSAMHSGVSCSHTLLLTADWGKGSGQLVKTMMERMNQTPPQPLLDMVKRAQETQEEMRTNFDLCYELKAWGLCTDSQCPSRHTHNTSPSSFPSPQPMELPQDGSVKLKVKHVSTATRWWVSLLGHAPLYRGAEPVKSHDPDGLLKMTFDLAKYFTPERQLELLHSAPAEGNYCALKDRDGCFYRVRILRFSRPLEFMFHHREKAKVRLIDTGEARIVDVSQLLALPGHLLSPPALVFEVFLCGVRPTDFDPDWPPQAAEAMRGVYGDQEVHGRVVLVSGETVWLHPVERRFTLTGLNITTALTSPRQQLIKAGMAEWNPDHLVSLSNRLGLPLVAIKHVFIDDSRLSFASLSGVCGDGVEVCVSAVDSPNRFYLQPMATESKVIELEDSLNRYNEVGSMVSDLLPVRAVCVAQFSYNKSWYRGCVLEVEGRESRIRYLDYGNVEWVPNHLVQPIHPTALELPFQAVCCTFGMEETKWGADAGTLLYEWTRESVLIAKVKSVAPSLSRLMYGAEVTTVELFEQTSGGGGGSNLALRLPAETSTARPQKPPLLVPIVSSALERLCLKICDSLTTTEERESVAMAIRNTVYNKPGLCISGCVLVSVCQNLSSDTPPSVSIPLLKALCCLATFHSSICKALSHTDCLRCILALVENSSELGDVLTQTLLLVVILLKHASRSSLLCNITSLQLFLRTCNFRIHANNQSSHQHRQQCRHGNADIHRLLVPILHHITTLDPELLSPAAEHGIIPFLCDSLAHSSSIPSSSSSSSLHKCHVLLVLDILGGVAKIPHHQLELSQQLPLHHLQTLLTKDSTTKMVHAILGLLVPLCTLSEFGARLYSSSLFAGLCKLPMTALTGIMLQLLKIHMEPLLRDNHHGEHSTNRIMSPISDSDDDSIPPLVNNGDDPLISRNNEEPSRCTAASKSLGGVDKAAAPPIASDEVMTSQLPQKSPPKIAALHPRVLWSQRESTVLLAVQLRGCEEATTEAEFSPATVSFRTRVWNQDYQFSVNLYATIDPTECSLSLTGSEALLRLVKTTPAKWWRLLREECRLTHFSVDFNRWEDEEFGTPINSSNWPTPPIKCKSASYVNPVLTESDLDSDTESDSSKQRENGSGDEEAWEDDLDVGFGN